MSTSAEHSHVNDPAFAALRAADSTIPDSNIEKMRQKVEANINLSGNEISQKKRPVWLIPSAATAAIALTVGSVAGYSVAASGSTTTRSETAFTSEASSRSAMMPGTAAQSSADKMMMPYYPSSRAILIPAPDLSDEASSAHGFVISDSSVKRKTLAKELASVFGLEGVSTLPDGGGYVVGDDTYVKANATVNGSSDVTASWYFNDPARSPWASCTSQTSEPGSLPNPTASISTGDVAIPEQMCPAATGTALSESQAIEIAQQIFARLGLEKEQATWTTKSQGWFGTDASGNELPFVHVEAALLADGMSTGMMWTLDVDPEGNVSSASGMAAKFVATAKYDIISPKQAAMRSTDINWIALGPTEKWKDGEVYPLAYSNAQVKTGEVTQSSTASKKDKDAEGRPLIASPTESITIDSFAPTLVNYSLSDGSLVLLPGYELIGQDRTFIQIAIADKYLAK